MTCSQYSINMCRMIKGVKTGPQKLRPSGIFGLVEVSPQGRAGPSPGVCGSVQAIFSHSQREQRTVIFRRVWPQALPFCAQFCSAWPRGACLRLSAASFSGRLRPWSARTHFLPLDSEAWGKCCPFSLSLGSFQGFQVQRSLVSSKVHI